MKLGARREATGDVGSYGCAAGRGQIVRVALGAGFTRPPTTVVVRCPACGLEHRVRPTWRRATERDAGREPDLVIHPNTTPKG